MKITDIILSEERLQVGDSFDLELGQTVIETGIVGFMSDGVILESDLKTLALLKANGATFETTNKKLTEGGMSEVSIIFGEIADGVASLTDILLNPQSKEELYVSDKLKQMMEEVVEDYGFNPETNQVEILQQLLQRVKDDFGTNSETIQEAEYQGRKVQLGKPMAGDVKKSKVYVKGPKGNVVKVNFGDKKMKIKKSNPKRRKSFRARHNCDNPGPRWKARYWSCRAW